MATGLHRIAPYFPGLQFRIDSKWGSNNPDSRGLIRESIVRVLSQIDGGLDAEEQNQIFILKGRPVLKSWALSISHCKTKGGWAAIPFSQTDKPSGTRTGIGFDVETAARITLPVIERFCTASEIALVPHAVYLWAAKEAAYKSVPSAMQPKVVSGLHILTWKMLSPGIYEYQASIPGSGIFTEMGGLHYALFKT